MSRERGAPRSGDRSERMGDAPDNAAQAHEQFAGGRP